MTDDQFDKLIARFNRLDERMGDLEGSIEALREDMVTDFATITATLSTLAIGQVNLFNLLISHSTNPGAHR